MKIRLIGLSGSLRRGSHNTALLRAAAALLPQDAEIEVHDYSDVPLYNADLDGEKSPDPVKNLRRVIAEADGLLIATPEYNYGIPGVLKNAIDWASRPAFKSSLTGKPVGVLSASASAVGGARAQAALRHVLGGTLSPVFPHVEMLIAAAHEQFDAEGRLTHADTERRLRSYTAKLVDWIRRQRAQGA